MAVWNETCDVFPWLYKTGHSSGSRHGVVKSACYFIRTQACTLALSLTLVHSVRLPREAFRYGAVPYLVVYSLWLLVIGLATSLLQLAVGQLSHQDPVGVWRAVPILRGVGHLQMISSFICCVYNMMHMALAAAYILWIGKDTFPLRICTKLQMTTNGYENKINASECYNSTFLSPFSQHPEYLGVMAVISFFLWYFVPGLLFGLSKSFKYAVSVITPVLLIISITLSIFLSKKSSLNYLLESCEHWKSALLPNIWFSAMIQALMSTHVSNGFLISAGGTIYKESDVRWVSTFIITCNIIGAWLWVLFWESIGGDDTRDTSFIAVLVLIYQSSLSEKRTKLWPILCYIVVLLSGFITILIYLFPIYDRLHRLTGDKWRIFATVASALGTSLTIAMLLRAVQVATILDDFLVPAIVVFSTVLHVIGFVFIYGCNQLRVDIEFVTAARTSVFWVVPWCLTPVLLIGITGWWLKVLLNGSNNIESLWPLGAILIGMLVIMAIVAAIATAKEEQYNLLSKIASAFKPSRLWGPEDPTIRYNWMLRRRSTTERLSEDNPSIDSFHPYHKTNLPKVIEDFPYYDEYNNMKDELSHRQTYYNYTKEYADFEHEAPIKYIKKKFESPNICIASDTLDSRTECKCNRHFTLNVPQLKSNELTTSL